MSLLDRISKDRIEGKVKLLLYGLSGAGKTTMIKTFPNLNKTLVIDIEKGLKSLGNLKVDSILINSLAEFNDLCKELKTDTIQNRYETIVIDSLTELQQYMINTICEEKKTNILTIGDWGIIANKCSRMIRWLRDLDYNIFVIAGAEENSKEEITYIRPLLSGKISRR